MFLFVVHATHNWECILRGKQALAVNGKGPYKNFLTNYI